MMEDGEIPTTSHVILFVDIHNCSIAINTLAENPYGFLQEVYEKLGDII
jgi:hypothetical protein